MFRRHSDCFTFLFSFKKKLKRSQTHGDIGTEENRSSADNQQSMDSGINNDNNHHNSGDHDAAGEHVFNNSNVARVRTLSASSPDINIDPRHEWMKRARKYQQSHYNSLGDRVWDLINSEDMLEMKIGFALYGVPTIMKNSDDNLTSLSYNDEQMKQINIVKNHIITLWHDITSSSDRQSDSLSIYFACVFVYLCSKNGDKKEGVDVLFRIPKILNEKLDDYLFIDGNRRTYVSWDDYLNKNKLPKCYMCYPLNGIYSTQDGMVEIGFKESPRCNLSKSILTGLDFTSTVLTLGATGVSVAAIAVPIAAPFIWGATATILASGAYDISRNVNRLVDIKSHYESLSFKNPESRGAWIGLAASAVGVASVGGAALSRSIMASEQIISKTGVITLRVINVSSIAISGIDVLNNLITILMKYLDGTLEKDDLLQFTSACYFFVNAIVSLNVVNRLIKDIASSDINHLFYCTKNSVHSFVKSAMEFTDNDSYYLLRALVLGVQSNLMPDINLNELDNAIFQISSLARQLSSGSMNWLQFTVELSNVMESIWIKFKPAIMRAIDDLCQKFKITDWRSYMINSKYKPFAQSSPDITRQFCMTLQKTVDHCDLDDSNPEYVNDILNLINEFNLNFPSEYSVDYLNKMKFICESFIKEFDLIKQDYEFSLDIIKSGVKSRDEFDLQNYNRNYGISGDKNTYFFNKALNKLRCDNVLKEMYNSYCDISNNCQRSSRETPCMETSNSCSYVFSGPPGRKALTDQQYFQKVNDFTGYNLNKDNSVLLSQKNIVFIRPNDESLDIKAAVFYSTYERDCVMGILTVLKNLND